MLELKNSGLPLYLNDNWIMALGAPLQYDGFGEKTVEQMLGLLSNKVGLNMAEKFYDVYRGIRYPVDEEVFKAHDLRYDITIIMDGLVNGECKKTSGHYHGYNPQRTNTYAEVYEVIKGRALYILQKSDNFEHEPCNIQIQDLILVTVEEGQSIIIPPNYGHCSVNIGDGPMVFSNLAYVPCPITYDPVSKNHGMSYYILRANGEICIKPNKHYNHVPIPKFATVNENEKFGIKFGLPVYTSFIKNPDAFRFLAEPDLYVQDIMMMLDYKDSI